LSEANFHTPGVETLILTTDDGAARLLADPQARAVTHIHSLGAAPCLLPPAILRLLSREFGVQMLLHEGGPTSLASFLAARCVDELFLTLAPQLAGRDADHLRPALISHQAFLPETAPWAQLVSLKRADEHLFLRYRLQDQATPRREAPYRSAEAVPEVYLTIYWDTTSPTFDTFQGTQVI
jgi:riboflavin biosynthesis pyrimidine reductase